MGTSSALPHVDVARCTGCGWCVAVCPPYVMSLQAQGWRKHSVLHDAQACTGCRKCERKCPFGAITMLPPASVVNDDDCPSASKPTYTCADEPNGTFRAIANDPG